MISREQRREFIANAEACLTKASNAITQLEAMAEAADNQLQTHLMTCACQQIEAYATVGQGWAQLAALPLNPALRGDQR